MAQPPRVLEQPAARRAELIGDAPGLAVPGAHGYRWMTDPDAGIIRRDGTVEFVI